MRSIVPSPPRLTARSSPAAKLVVGHAHSGGRTPSASSSAAGRCVTRARRASWPPGDGQLGGLRRGRGGGRGRRSPCQAPSTARVTASATTASRSTSERARRPGASGRGPEVDEELDVAVGPRERRHHDIHHRGSLVAQCGADLARAPAATLWVADDAPPRTTSVLARLELRLDEQDHVGAGRGQLRPAQAPRCASEMNDRSA